MNTKYAFILVFILSAFNVIAQQRQQDAIVQQKIPVQAFAAMPVLLLSLIHI